MTYRPTVLSAKVDCKAKITADADRLKAMKQTDRPANASLDAVRAAYADAMDDVAAVGASAAAVESVALPSERLQ